MKIVYHSKFIREYKKLPTRTKILIERRERIFRQNPFDSRLKTHKLSGRLAGHWPFSIDFSYRIIFDFIGKDTIRLYSVGNHDIYE